MKILITSEWYVPVVNGVVTSVCNLERELRKRGHEVRILMLSEDHTSHQERDVYYVGSLGAGKIYPNARLSLSIRNTYLEELIAWKPDIVHSQCEFTTWLFAHHIARRTGAALIHTYHTIYEDYTHYFSPNKALGEKVVAVFSRKVLNHVDAVIAPTRKVKRLLEKYRVEPGIFTVPTGIDLERFYRKDEKGNADLAGRAYPDTRRLVTVGRLAREKNIEEILGFLAEGRGQDYEYLIVGDGPYRPELMQKVKNLGLERRVEFTGMISPDQVPEYYRKGDVFVCASSSETQGLTYLEALASGLPAVCRKDPCLEGVVIDGYNGWQYEDADGFFDGLERLFANRKVYGEASANACEKALDFSKEVFAGRIEEIYRIALRAKQEGAEWNKADRRDLQAG